MDTQNTLDNMRTNLEPKNLTEAMDDLGEGFAELGNNVYEMTIGGFGRTTKEHEFSDELLASIITKDDDFPDGNPCDGHKVTQEDVGNVLAEAGILLTLAGFGIGFTTIVFGMLFL